MFMEKKCQVVFLLLSCHTVSNRKCIHTKLHLNFRNGDPHKGIIILDIKCLNPLVCLGY